MLLPRRWIYVRSVCVYVQSVCMSRAHDDIIVIVLSCFGDMSCALGVCVCGGGGGGDLGCRHNERW